VGDRLARDAAGQDEGDEGKPMMTRTNPAVRQVQQPESMLCWATCVLMAIEVKRNKVNPDITPEKIIEKQMSAKINKGGFDYHTKVALEDYGAKNVTIAKGPAAWDAIKAEIGRNRPVILSYVWAGPGAAGHQMVIGGWEEDANGFPWVALYDPLQTVERRVNYDCLVRGNYDPDGFRGEGNKWVSYYTFD
jgi:hypothetical protein